MTATTAAKLARARDAVVRAATAYFDALRDDKSTEARRVQAHLVLEHAVRDHTMIESAHLGAARQMEESDEVCSCTPAWCRLRCPVCMGLTGDQPCPGGEMR
jgi:dienelactone hydrolase